ncbi:ATP-binding sensor histidine kinase [Bacillus sp. FJAT-50079]|uniref:ATP-binding sensor histidine kinase n=1 Tax=Bacillus sp. FJAT-50079 TaxID=2833577 RepID=UPI001BC8E6DE|nr:ATP-binding sensor histidine kinase [Bacillus sp. FJAT-50079]MBS4209393.1 AAA family ATPase [Bacillus sp. FJAT-50079]
MNVQVDLKMNLPGYEMIQELDTNRSWNFYSAFDQSSGKTVLIKGHVKEHTNSHDLAAATHEFHLMKELHMNGMLVPIALEKHWNRPFLIMEPFDGISLSTFMNNKKIDIDMFINIAKELTAMINKLHNHHVIHKNIQPDNILVNKQATRVKLTGFYHAAKLRRENHRSHVNPYTLGRQLMYIAPEQTGRLYRYLDYRSDLYSLGVVFYEMLTGNVPFEREDPIELVHAHIAKNPVPPIEVNPFLPQMLSEIVMKLLAKMPESRYQSASGLTYDLIEFEKLWKAEETTSQFLLAQKDTPQSFEIGEKLYGREEAIESLLSAFEHTCKGHCTFVLIPGVSGIGKTALVNEVQKPLVRNKGYFISGKFDQLKSQVPYAPLIHAFQDLLKQAMAEGEKSIRNWKARLESELGAYLPVIAKILPEIKWITGELPEPEVLPAIETKNRNRYALLTFVHVFAQEQHPLVLFFDDLQWADQATLDLVQFILSQQKTSYLFVIGAYRDNEVDITHPFRVMLNELQEHEGLMKSIPLKPLQKKHIEEWVANSLLCEVNEGAELASLMYKITQGNPFFMKQLFQSFYDQQLIKYDEKQIKWISDPLKLSKLDIQEDIIRFIAKRFYKLPEETQKLLKLASCIGNQFDLNVLSAVYEKNSVVTTNTLWKGLEEGLLLPLSPSYKWIYSNEDLQVKEEQPLLYRFLHDRVQQAIYSTMTTEELENNHLTIGKLLLDYYTGKNSFEEYIFVIVNHLNHCRNRLNNNEKLQLAEWNTIAGEKAKQGAAFKASLSFFTIAKELLGENGWETHNELTTKITIGLGEVEYLDNEFENAEKRFDEALERVQSKQDQLKIYNLKIALYIHLHRVEEAVDCGLKALQLFGLTLNKRPGKAAIAWEFLQTKIALRTRKANDLKRLPKMKEGDERLIMQTLINMNAPAYHVDQNLATLLMLKAFNYMMKHGTVDLSALVYNNYSLILSAGFHQYKDSYEYGQLALHYAENSQNSHLLGRVYFVYASFVNHWKKHLMFNQQYLERSQKYCIESGNFHLAGAASSFICIASFLQGHRLVGTLQIIDQQLQFTKQIQYDLSKNFLNELTYWIDILQETAKVPDWNLVQMTDDQSAEIVHYTLRLQLTYILDEQDVAKSLLKKLNQLVDSSLVLIIAPEYYFYEALWMMKMYSSEKVERRLYIRKRLKKHLSLWKRWAKESPENYLHKYLLIKAEEARMKKRMSKAALLYDQAIVQAQKNGFIQDTAIANECAGYFYFGRGLPYVAKVYIQAAHSAYENWGASRKALLLRNKHRDLFVDGNQAVIQTDELEQYSFDYATVMKAAQAFSGEIVLEKLIARLMDIVLENSGAQKAVMFLKIEEQLKAVAQGNIKKTITLIDEEDVVEYPANIVHYVERSLDPVVLTNGAVTGVFTNDDYMKAYDPKSILCFPILHQGKLIGALYLENNMVTHAFTKERIDLLNFLSSQAAISLENAFLYRNLEKKVKERTALLESAYENLEKANQHLAQEEKRRRQFLSDISHDLRSPLTSAQGYIEAILDGVIEKEEDQFLYLERSHQRLLTLNRMIHDLFELAKLESRGLSFDMEYVPCDQLLKHLSNQFEPDIIDAHLTFTMLIESHSQENRYPLVKVDIRRMEQVIQNLVSNAIKFTKTGGITLQYTYDEFNKEAMFTLEDTGVGISKDELPFIFERFYTKSSERKDGHGLGLAICKEIIHYHQGEITAESIEGQGTRFNISLPVYELEEAFE